MSSMTAVILTVLTLILIIGSTHLPLISWEHHLLHCFPVIVRDLEENRTFCNARSMLLSAARELR